MSLLPEAGCPRKSSAAYITRDNSIPKVSLHREFGIPSIQLLAPQPPTRSPLGSISSATVSSASRRSLSRSAPTPHNVNPHLSPSLRRHDIQLNINHPPHPGANLSNPVHNVHLLAMPSCHSPPPSQAALHLHPARHSLRRQRLHAPHHLSRPRLPLHT